MHNHLDQSEIDKLLQNSGSENAVENCEAAGRDTGAGQGKAAGEKASSGGKGPEAEKVQFTPLKPRRAGGKKSSPHLFNDIPLVISGELGTAEITVRELLKLEEGSVIKLNKMAGDSATILVNEQYLGQGEVVVVNDRFGLRITTIGSEGSKVPGDEKEGKEESAAEVTEEPPEEAGEEEN